jgi:hypothetical protein
LLWEVIGTCATLAAAWFVMRRGGVERALAAALVAGLLISCHGFLADAFLLVPVAMLMLDAAGTLAEKITAVLLLCPISFVPFIAGGGLYPPALIVVLPLAVLAVSQWSGDRRGKITPAPRASPRRGSGDAPRAVPSPRAGTPD